MIELLSISNYVLIEKLQIDFQSGFSVITGETGAGKSIFLGALALILGERADKEVILNPDKKCIIEGHFNIDRLNLESFFEENDLDYDNNCILRREITYAGKSRAFINDTPVNLPLLKELALLLMDIHSQNQNQQLNNSAFRLRLLDAYSNHNDILKKFREEFKQYKEDVKRLDTLKDKHLKQQNELEYHQFLFDEIEKAKIEKGEQLAIEEELQLLTHTEEIKSNLFFASHELLNSDENIVHRIQSILDKLKKISRFQHEIEELEARLQTVYIELKDIGEEASSIEDVLQFDPARFEYLNDRLAELFSLCRKHKLDDADDLLGLQNSLSDKIHSVMNLEEEISKLNKRIKSSFNHIEEQALILRKNRSSAATQIETLVIRHLHELGMSDAEFKIDLKDLPEMSVDGKDQTVFLFKANKGSKLLEISKVASGGELSRIMMAFKYVLALKQELPSIVFDEIDNGVSGEIADKLARLMKNLGKEIQVISISHLPQIASKADHHYLVYKENDSIFTRSLIKKLNNQERLTEVASMLSGSSIEVSAIEHAKELLGF